MIFNVLSEPLLNKINHWKPFLNQMNNKILNESFETKSIEKKNFK